MSREALRSSVLVLNRSFAPVHIVTVKRAFCLLCKAVAQVVDVEDGQLELHDFQSWQDISEFKKSCGLPDKDMEWVSTVSLDLVVPRVIRLLVYDRLPRRRASFNRRNIFARDENRCQYCGKRFPTTELSIDHIVPLACGGKNDWTNVVCACTDCNKRKGGKTPQQAAMTLIRKPFVPKTNPEIRLKLRRRKYYSWKQFLSEAYWSVTLD